MDMMDTDWPDSAQPIPAASTSIPTASAGVSTATTSASIAFATSSEMDVMDTDQPGNAQPICNETQASEHQAGKQIAIANPLFVCSFYCNLCTDITFC